MADEAEHSDKVTASSEAASSEPSTTRSDKRVLREVMGLSIKAEQQSALGEARKLLACSGARMASRVLRVCISGNNPGQFADVLVAAAEATADTLLSVSLLRSVATAAETRAASGAVESPVGSSGSESQPAVAGAAEQNSMVAATAAQLAGSRRSRVRVAASVLLCDSLRYMLLKHAGDCAQQAGAVLARGVWGAVTRHGVTSVSKASGLGAALGWAAHGRAQSTGGAGTTTGGFSGAMASSSDEEDHAIVTGVTSGGVTSAAAVDASTAGASSPWALEQLRTMIGSDALDKPELLDTAGQATVTPQQAVCRGLDARGTVRHAVRRLNLVAGREVRERCSGFLRRLFAVLREQAEERVRRAQSARQQASQQRARAQRQRQRGGKPGAGVTSAGAGGRKSPSSGTSSSPSAQAGPGMQTGTPTDAELESAGLSPGDWPAVGQCRRLILEAHRIAVLDPATCIGALLLDTSPLMRASGVTSEDGSNAEHGAPKTADWGQADEESAGAVGTKTLLSRSVSSPETALSEPELVVFNLLRCGVLGTRRANGSDAAARPGSSDRGTGSASSNAHSSGPDQGSDQGSGRANNQGHGANSLVHGKSQFPALRAVLSGQCMSLSAFLRRASA